MAKIFRSVTEIKNQMNLACNIAVKNACERLLKKLREIIKSKYYDQYDPKMYVRTEQFLDSAMMEMLTKNCGRIFMNENAMNYKEWTGELQIQYASQGYHGSTHIRASGRFWETFTDFCENNVRQILREELIRQGVPIIN